VAWPLTVPALGLTVWFGSPKQDRAGLLRRLRKAGPSGVELEQAEKEIATAVQPVHDAITRSDEGTRTASDDAQIQRRMSQLIDAAARWGWIKAGRSRDEFPHPIVAWSDHDAIIVASNLKLNPGDTVSLATGSFVNPRTGRANASSYTITNWQPGEDLDTHVDQPPPH
jgi:hypothetical protein